MIQLDEARLRNAISDILDTAPDVPEVPLDVDSPRRRRWHVDLVAAAAVVAVGVAGVIVVATRDEDSSRGSSGTTTVPSTTAPRAPFAIPADGRLVFDPVPEGLSATYAARQSWDSPPETQVYVENRTNPELGPAVFIRAIAEANVLPSFEDADHVTVQSAPGVAYTAMNGEHVAFGPVDGVTYYLDGYGITRDELLRVAEGARTGEHLDPSIDPQTLLPGMTSLTAGSYNESDVFSPATLSSESVGASWLSDDQSRVLTYGIRAEHGHLFAVNRLAHASVREIEIDTLDGYVRVDEFPSGQRSIVVTVTDGERTLFVGGAGYTEDEMIAFAETLRPATDEEWSSMLLATDESAGELNAPPTPGTEG